MAASRLSRIPTSTCLIHPPLNERLVQHSFRLRSRTLAPRCFSASTRRFEQDSNHRKESFSSRLRSALAKTKITWYPIPVGLGIGFLGFLQFTKVQKRERERLQDEQEAAQEPQGRPKKRQRPKPTGPWSVQIMSTLPLKAISRVWGKFNEITIPYYLRVPGFKLYGWIFGVNFNEVSEPDLHVYPNLASFFYRTLKPGVRPLDPNHNALLSPADGKVVQFGTIEPSGELEQVKGVTYSLDALLGSQGPSGNTKPSSNIQSSPGSPQPGPTRADQANGQADRLKDDEEFAKVNGISYTLPNLFSGPLARAASLISSDQSTTPKQASETAVQTDLAKNKRHWWEPEQRPTPTTLYYMVVYLAPGDYHRFHSPVSWVVSTRRHFAGELYSVSPYLVRTLPGLFTLNERVVLLGRWRHGFFSYTPVGATNVGSIVINFDRELRTNSLTTDTAADRAAEEAQNRGEPYSGYAEANYDAASQVLSGHALRRGEEMGGFKLGSTIVMVFEAPKGRRRSLDEGFGFEEGDQRKGGWRWGVNKGDKVKMGQALGWVEDDGEKK